MSTKASSPPTLHACLLSLADPPWLPYRIMTSLSAFIYVLLLPSRPTKKSAGITATRTNRDSGQCAGSLLQ